MSGVLSPRSFASGRVLAVTMLSILSLLLPAALFSSSLARARHTEEIVRADASAIALVSIVDFAFQPQVVTVTAGSKVRWTNTSPLNTHTSTSDDFRWDSGNLAPGQMFTLTFNRPGILTYHCAIHSSMTGKVVVQIQTYLPLVFKAF